MNAPRYWQLRDDTGTLYRLTDQISANTPHFSHSYSVMNFMGALAIRILIANNCTR